MKCFWLIGKWLFSWQVLNKSILEAGTLANQVSKFKITGTKLFVPIVILSTQKNIKLLKQLESCFKRRINWNKYNSKKSVQAQWFNYSGFQGVHRLFVLSFGDNDGWKSYKQYYLSSVEIKDYNAVIDGRNFFDQSIKNDLETYDNIKKIVTDQGDDYTTECLLDYPYFKQHCKLIAVDLIKQ